MGIIISAELSNVAGEYFKDVRENLDQPTPVTDSDVVNYSLEMMSALELMLQRTIGESDVADFINGVTDGSIVVVKKSK